MRTLLISAGILAAGLLAPSGIAAFDSQPSEVALPSLSTSDTALREGTRAFRSGDMEAAIKALEMAADGGEPLALWKLGDIYHQGDGVEADKGKAFQFYRKLANEYADDNPRGRYSKVVSSAFVRLGGYFLEGIPDTISPDSGQAVRLYRHAAMYFADPEAQYRLARIYLDNDHIKADSRLAARWLKLAAEKSHIEAQAILGRLMWLGDGITRRPVEGLGWMLIAQEAANNRQREWISPLVNETIAEASELTIRHANERLETWRIGHMIALQPSG